MSTTTRLTTGSNATLGVKGLGASTDSMSSSLSMTIQSKSATNTTNTSNNRPLISEKWIKKLSGKMPHLGNTPLEALVIMADAYETGQGIPGIPQDHSRAFFLYANAAKQNHALSSYKLACCYEEGRGTKRDHSKALRFYKKASALGEPKAMHRLGLALLQGELGCPEDQKEGITWLKQAVTLSSGRLPEALHDLAGCHERSSGCTAVIPDEPYARELYVRACGMNYAPSVYRMAAAYEYGHFGLRPSASRCIRLYERAAELGSPEAMLALSAWHLTGAVERPDGGAAAGSTSSSSKGIKNTQEVQILEASEVFAYVWARRAAERQFPKTLFVIGYYWQCCFLLFICLLAI